MKPIGTILLIALWLVTGCNERRYFPPPDAEGGWRTLDDPAEIRQKTGIDVQKLDAAYEFIKGSTKNGGLLVVRNGWLVYENYFGKGHREATPNLASCGKSITSVSVGILMDQHPELFSEGLDQKVFNTTYFPDWVFPLPDPRMAQIKLGQLLAFSAGIRGNNPVWVNGRQDNIDPVGPDGWYAIVDEMALGKEEGMMGQVPFSTKTLWCEPGGGYSYATASIHIASIMLRHLSGMEMQNFVEKYIASQIGWGRWSFGYKYQSRVNHTPGGGGIALRATDMLRFGYLMLNGGRWNDKQVIPEWYVKHCASESPYNPHYPYSLQFNVNAGGQKPDLPEDAFWKTGSGNHCLYVVPSLDLVVWKLGGRDGQYESNDTGLQVHPDALKAREDRSDFKVVNDPDEAMLKLLEMVIESIEPK